MNVTHLKLGLHTRQWTRLSDDVGIVGMSACVGGENGWFGQIATMGNGGGGGVLLHAGERGDAFGQRDDWRR